MATIPQLAPLIILIPAIGAFINMFWGARLGEKMVAIIGTTAAALAFIVALMLSSYLMNNSFTPAVVNPPFLDGWLQIDSAGINIPWQQRVDTLSVTMMLVITGVGTLIHLYAAGYMHGDARFHRFFTYLNMFLAFMLILVTGNNFLMMFVGWEGVGLCSFLLIGFWFDRANGVGWKNSNAARKAFIVNRIGDFGLLMGIFLMFWTFGTLDYYRPGEIANPEAGHHAAAEGEHAAAAGEGEHAETAAEGDHSETAVEGDHAEEGVIVPEEHTNEVVSEAHIGEDQAAAEGEHTEAVTDEHATAAEGEHAAAEGDHGAAEGEHGEAAGVHYTDNEHIALKDLGVFGQAERLLTSYEYGAPERVVHFGPYSLDLLQVIGLITFFMLIGATGKSAQIPLFVWLPDAMAGPTPVSALIHAATMVTAGVYMMTRSSTFYHYAEFTSFIVAMVGVSTAVVAGFIAIGQWDIKRVLAYSTVSQLGFMVAAVGIGAYGAAMFHLVTHAFFKALLFLGSGSVIHGVEHGHHHVHEHAHGHVHDAHDEHGHDAHDAHAAHGEGDHEEEAHADDFDPQDMRNMGGLNKRMPITYVTYLLGTLALAGIWPLAGFWSKDEILADAWTAGFVEGKASGFIVLAGLLLAAAFTAFYMWRQIEMVFHGKPRTEAAAHAPESVPSMTIPLVVLAVLSVLGGLMMNIPEGAGILGLTFEGRGLHSFASALEQSTRFVHAGAFNPVIALIATVAALAAIFVARGIYGADKAVTADGRDPLQLNPGFRPFWALANARMYWDQTYFRLLENPFNKISKFLADRLDWDFWHDYVHDTVIYKGFNAVAELLSKPVDLGLIDGAVNGLGRLVRWFSDRLRGVQTGYVRTYAVSLLLGVILVIVLLLLPLLQRVLASGN